MSKFWTSPVYAFYDPVPEIIYVEGQRCHVFKCSAHGCSYTSCWFLTTKDKSSTGNLIKHVKACRGWGEETWAAATACGTAKEARELVTKPGIKMSGSILTSFAQKGKGKVTYSHLNHTKTETKYVPLPILVSSSPRLMPCQ